MKGNHLKGKINKYFKHKKMLGGLHQYTFSTFHINKAMNTLEMRTSKASFKASKNISQL